MRKFYFRESMIIPWMMAVAILPMILVSIIAYSLAQDILNQAIDNYLITSIQKKVDFLNDYISERKLTIIEVSKLPDVIEIINRAESKTLLSPKEQAHLKIFITYLKYLAEKIGLNDLYIIDLNGKVIFSLFEDPFLGKTLTPADPFELESYRAFDGARILRMPYLYNEYKYSTPSATETSILLTNPILEDGKTKGVLFMRLQPHIVQEVIKRQLGFTASEETILGMLVKDKPVIIMHGFHGTKKDVVDATTNTRKTITNLLEKAIRGQTGGPLTVTENNRKMILVYQYVPQLNMGMVFQYDKSEVFQRIYWLKFHMIFLIATSLLLVFLVVYWISRELWKANIKSEQLLKNILPEFVIDELKEKKQFLARNIASVSIVFVDIANFTQFASGTSPEKVVQILDQLFSIFDHLCEKYQLEKIKTIGDAYMAVANLISEQEDHANRAVNLGLDMINAVKEYNQKHQTNFTLRVGIDSGSITAGIIGKKKFSYDLWGNAVNRASRMESTGIVNKIQLTTETHQLLQNRSQYHITIRKGLVVKGLGELDTYIIES